MSTEVVPPPKEPLPAAAVVGDNGSHNTNTILCNREEHGYTIACRVGSLDWIADMTDYEKPKAEHLKQAVLDRYTELKKIGKEAGGRPPKPKHWDIPKLISWLRNHARPNVEIESDEYQDELALTMDEYLAKANPKKSSKAAAKRAAEARLQEEYRKKRIKKHEGEKKDDEFDTPPPPEEKIKSKRDEIKVWSTEQVISFLREAKLEQFIDVFTTNEIDGALMLVLDHEQLENDLGIASKLTRNKVLTKIERLYDP
eukprot:m.17952 g.17952  ORF g.17952 m.17952 type:complete len:256 (+) comp6150_c0_seq1:337-1104(+)